MVCSCVAFVVIVLSDEPRQNQGRELVDHKLVKPPSNFIAGRQQAALLFWFFGDFRCGMSLFMVILVIYKYKKVKIVVKCRLAGDLLCGKLLLTWLSLVLSLKASFCAVLFPRNVLDEIADLIESVSGGFLPTLVSFLGIGGFALYRHTRIPKKMTLY